MNSNSKFLAFASIGGVAGVVLWWFFFRDNDEAIVEIEKKEPEIAPAIPVEKKEDENASGKL